ncbi:MAG: glycosyltransferase, partial [Fidelibacterota bacterium]
ITGRYLTNHLKRRIDITNGIEYAGFVKNIDQLVAESILCLAPIMSGAGLKMKLTQALQCGTPVITTPVGAEGIPLSEDDGLFVEQDIPAMVERTLALLQAPETLITLGQKARQRVGEVFDSDGILEKLNNLYHQALKNS